MATTTPTDFIVPDTGSTVTTQDATNSNVLVVDAGNAKVGVNTATPGAELDVRGAAVFNEDGDDNDFRVEGDTDANLIVADASTDKVSIGTATPGAKLDVRGDAVFNEDGGDNDFRVEGDTDTNLVVADASADSVGIGTATPKGKLHIQSATFGTITPSERADELVVENIVESPENLDDCGISIYSKKNKDGYIVFADEEHDIPAFFRYQHGNDTMRLYTLDGSNAQQAQSWRLNEIIVNPAKRNANFRVHGDTNEDILFCDAGTEKVGIGTGSPAAKLDVRGDAVFNEDGGDSDFRVEGDTDANLIFADASADAVGIGTSTPSGKL